MSNIPITPGTGVASVATETIAGFDYQKVKIVDGTASSTNPWKINADGSANVSVIGTITTTPSQGASISGTVLIGNTVTINSPSVYGNISGSVIAFQGGTQSTSVMGGPITLYASSASFISGVTSIITSTGLTSVLTAAGGSIKNYVTHILVTNAAAAGTFVDVVDGGGNVLYSGYAAASGGGFSATMPVPLSGSANKSVDVKARAQASIIAAMTGYTA